jgi:hypothetical protein
MADGDLRTGRCGLCGSEEIYQGRLGNNMVLMPPGGVLGKNTRMLSLICCGCGQLQVYVEPGPVTVGRLRRKFWRVPVARRLPPEIPPPDTPPPHERPV